MTRRRVTHRRAVADRAPNNTEPPVAPPVRGPRVTFTFAGDFTHRRQLIVFHVLTNYNFQRHRGSVDASGNHIYHYTVENADVHHICSNLVAWDVYFRGCIFSYEA